MLSINAYKILKYNFVENVCVLFRNFKWEHNEIKESLFRDHFISYQN